MFVSFDEIYESIRSIEILINQNNRHVGKIVDQIKFLKIDNNRLIRDLNLLKLKDVTSSSEKTPKSAAETSNYIEEDSLDASRFGRGGDQRARKSGGVTNTTTTTTSMTLEKEEEENSLDKGLSRMHLKVGGEQRDTQFFSQLYEVLRKRKQIPTQEISLNKLDLYDERFDQVAAGAGEGNQVPSSTASKTPYPQQPTSISSAAVSNTIDTSFLKLNSPNITAVAAATATPMSQQFQPSAIAAQPSIVPNVVINTPNVTPQKGPLFTGGVQTPNNNNNKPPLFSISGSQHQQQQQLQPQQPKPPSVTAAVTAPPQASGLVFKPQLETTTKPANTTSTPAPVTSQAPASTGLFNFNASTAPTTQQTPLFNLPGLSKPNVSLTTESSKTPAKPIEQAKSAIVFGAAPAVTATASATSLTTTTTTDEATKRNRLLYSSFF